MKSKRAIGILVTAIALLGLPNLVSRAHASSGTVTGTVFLDKNANGTNDGSDIGVGAVAVAAYDSSGIQVGTATSASDGTYTLTVASASTTAVRVEFTTPAGYQPSFQGSGSGTSIQFATLSATNINYSLIIPGNYCEDNAADPLVVSTCIRPGSITGLATAENTLTSSRWSSRTSVSQMLTHAQTGATWGIAQDRATGLVWNSAVLRRHAGLGPKGLGGLYVTTTTGGNVVASFDVGTLVDQGGNPILLSANDSLYTDAARGLSTTTPISIDLAGYEGVGQVGLGDIDITPDGYLWVTNLYEKTILRIRIEGTVDAPTLGAVTEYTVPQLSATTCNTGGTITNNVAHPWALEYNQSAGTMYVGIVCGRESNAVGYSSPMQTGTGGSAAAIGGAAIVELNPAGSGSWTRVTSILINKQRFIEGCNDVQQITSNQCKIMNWKGWSNNFSSIYALNTAINSNFTDLPRYPQPVMADIEILKDGSLVAGFLDRWSMQLGANNIKPTETTVVLPWTGSLMSGNVSGDLQLLCKTGANSWTQEASTAAGVSPQKGGCVGITTTGGATYESSARSFNGLYDYGLGPMLLVPLDKQPDNNGYLEFFNDSVCDASINLDGTNTASFSCLNAIIPNHIEITQGGLAVWPPTGSQELAVASMDPANNFDTGGVRWYDMADGDSKWGLKYTELPNVNSTTDTSFLKSSSMGDIEIICDRAPVQIGNRVWIDSNNNGIQDPGEAPVVGATVRLYDSTGTTLRGTAITNANGEYYFSTNVTEVAAGNGDNSGGGIALGNAYKIRINNPTDYASGGPLFGYELTSALATSSATDLDTSVDNNATVVNSYPDVAVATIRAGTNNHTYDVGFVLSAVTTTTTAATTTTLAPTTTTAPGSTVAPSASTTVAPGSVTSTTVSSGNVTTTTTAKASSSSAQSPISVSCGDYVWWDVNRDGIQDPTEKGIAGVVLTIKNVDGSPVTNVFGKSVSTTTTNSKGYYSFDNLPPGQYVVTVVDPAGFGPTKTNGTSNTAADSSTHSATSVVMTVDGQRDPTLDFGFYKPDAQTVVSVGNYVWRDLNGDGLQGPADGGVKGAVLSLTNADGSSVLDVFGRPVKNQKTKADGKYMFTLLPPGKYIVNIAYPKNFFPTTPNRNNRGKNSSTVTAKSLNLPGGSSDITLDFGMVYRSMRVLPATL